MAEETIETNISENDSDLTKALKILSKKAPVLKPFYKYYEGDHGLNFASDKFRSKYGNRLNELKDNLCKTVVDAPASRLEIINFATDKKDVKDQAWEIWKRNLMPLKSKEVHKEALKTGKSYVIVWTDAEGKAKIFPQVSANCYVWKDPETGKALKGVKAWRNLDDGKYYLTLYYPDRTEKYITINKASTLPTNQNSFVKRQVTGEENPLPNPFGRIPLIEFDNTGSVLTDIIPLQKALNKSLADLFVAMEYNSIRQRWTSGITYEKDPETGKKIIPYDHEEQYVATDNKDGKFGEFTDSDLEKIIKVNDSMRAEIARVSGIPAHYFMLGQNQFPSGEAMRTAEARFTELITDCQLGFGESWSEVMSQALEVENLGEQLTIETQWADPAPVGEREQLENGVLKQQLGWSQEKIQEDFGLTEDQIKKMSDQNSERARNDAENQARAFNMGSLGGDQANNQ